jgi:hypothetical protein
MKTSISINTILNIKKIKLNFCYTLQIALQNQLLKINFGYHWFLEEKII